MLLQAFPEQPKLVRLVPLLLTGQQSGVGYTVLGLDSRVHQTQTSLFAYGIFM